MRLDAYLAHTNQASRREAKRLVEEGAVLVNNTVVTIPSTEVTKKDIVTLRHTKEKTTILVYKPKGVTCSHARHEGKTIYDMFPSFAHLTYIGRLDKESEGLLLLSDDGRITKLITGTDKVEKEYVITVRETVQSHHIKSIEKGMRIENDYTQPARAQKIDAHTLRIILREGKKHQVRRMANALHLTVHSLVRTRIGPLSIGSLKPGNARKITKKEYHELIVLL